MMGYNMAKAVIIDGNSIINRAYYGIRGMTNSDGFPTNAIFGFMNIFDRLLGNIKPEYIAVCFDLKGGTFRNEMYAEYKANRSSMDMDLAVQLPVLKEILSAMGYKILEKQGFEADDLIGTLAYSFSDLDHQAYILTGDKDSLQLVGDNRYVCYHGTKNKVVYDEQKVKEDLGVMPNRVIDLKGLMGDSSDNIPGVKGVGKVTALKLLNQFDTVENLIENAEEIEQTRIRNLVIKDSEMAILSKKLATIDCNVAIDFELNDYLRKEEDLDALQDLFTKYELRSLAAKYKGKISKKTSNAFKHTDAEDTNLGEALNTFNFSEAIFYDLIKDDDKPLSKDFDYLLLYQSGNKPLFFDESNAEVLFDKLKEASEKNPLILKADKLKELMLILRANDIEVYKTAFDLSLADYLLDPNRNDNDISFLASKYLGISIMPLRDIFDKGKKTKSAAKVDVNELKKCLALRMQAAEQLEPILIKELKEKDLFDVYKDIEMPLNYVLVDMQVAGFKVNLAELKRIDKELEDLILDIENQVYFMAGQEFNINSPKQLGKVLFEDMGLKSGKKTKTGYSTSKDVLEKLAKENPIIDKILQYRTYSKLKSTYSEGLQYSINKDTGAIHSYLEQTVAATGRISSHNPNLQNIPIRYELGRELRKAFVAKDDEHILLSADYSQIELRILAHLSKDKKMIDAYNNGIDIHALTASQIFDKDLDAISLSERSDAKAINFGIIYGMGKYSLSEDLNISYKAAEEYISNYFAKYPDIKVFLDKAQEDAKEKGYATTLFGRKRPIPELKHKNFNIREYGKRMAMNAPIQGTSADIIKIAMIKVYSELKARGLKSKLIMQIHDELIIDTLKVEFEEVKTLLIEAMKNACQLDVPLVIDVNSGETWYEAK